VPTLGASGSPTGVDGDDDAVRVFMSYRRTDDANFTGRFHDKLIGVFGDANVFRDIDSIPAGTKFEDVITARLADVDAVVALIGATWDARLGSPSDFVRMEIAHALQSDTPVIPVLIEDTPLPTADSLPDDLKPMLYRQTVRVRRDPDFHRDAARVIDGVREAVAADRIRLAAQRKAEQETAQRRREEEQRRQELEAELARANARAEQERKAAEALALERDQRLTELARLEEEATQRRIADERARVAQIVESQAAREREAEAAVARAEQLRRELGGLPPVTLTEMTAEVEPEAVAPAAAAEIARHDEAPIPTLGDSPPVVIEQIQTDVADYEPAAPEVASVAIAASDLAVDEEVSAPAPATPADAPVADKPADVPPAHRAGPLTTVASEGVAPSARRSIASASRSEMIGSVLLLVATAFAVQALFDKTDYANAFDDGPWATDVLAVVITAALLLPFVVFYFGGNVQAVTAGTAAGYLAYQGLADASWFAYDDDSAEFPTNMVFIAILLGVAWFMFRRGSPVPPARIAHAPSRYLQIAAAVATVVATALYINLLDDYDAAHRILIAVVAVVIGMLILSVRRSLEATILLVTLAAETSFAFLTYAIAYEGTRDRALNVAIAAAVLTGAALWRARRAVPAPVG
jgi:TIR domain